MRKYIIAVLLMLAAGIALSVYLIPSEQEIAQFRQKDEQIRTAGFIDYEAEYDAGNRSEQVVVGLTNLYIGQERGPQAIPILEEHVYNYPDALQARTKLAELYQFVGRDDDYVEQIEYVAAKQPTESNLKLLSDMYNYLQQYDKQADALRQLINISKGANPNYYVDLATILSIQEKRGEAAGVIRELRAAHPNHVSYKLVRLIVMDHVDAGDMDSAFQEASSWTANETNYTNIADLGNILNYGGRPDLALQILEPHRQAVDKSLDFFTAYVNASINAGKRDQAYIVLSKAHQKGQLPAPLYRSLVDLALERDALDVAESVIDNLDPTTFAEDDAINMIELANAKQAQSLLVKLIQLFDQPAYRDGKPALQAIIAMIRRDSDEDQKVTLALDASLTRNSRLRLAQACARTGKEPCFDKLVKQFPELDEMSPREVNEVTDLYISVDRQQTIYSPLKALANNTETKSIKLAFIKLAASMGQTSDVQKWLNRNGRYVATGALNELFFLANDRDDHGATASLIAQVLYERDPNAKHREYLISGYLRSGNHAKALPLLREVRNQDRVNEDNYLAALTKLSTSDSTYRDELAEYIAPKLDDETVSSERKLQLVYMLINSGNKKLAMPTIDAYAKREGGEWKTVSNQLRGISGKRNVGVAITERSKDFRIAMARDPKTSDKTKRMLAFSLLDDGHRDDAIDIFFDLAQTAHPDSQEIKDLLYLWGARLNEGQINWLVQRASTAMSSSERARWAEHIANYGDDYALMQYVTDHPQALAYPSIRQKYFRALVTSAKADTFDQGMRRWVNSSNDPFALRDYADIATAYGYSDAALNALKRIEALTPKDEKTTKDLAVLSYNVADYSEAERYLNEYAQLRAQNPIPQTSPYEALYYQGELLRRSKKISDAKHFFRQIVQLAPREATTVNKQSIYYTSLFHLGHADRAKQGFYGLLAQNPNDKSLLADFISALLEYNFHEEALSVANRYDRRVPPPAPTQAIGIQSPNIQSIESYERGRELRLNFNGSINRNHLIRDVEQYGWVDSVKEGHDSLLIAAKPGYELRFRPTSHASVAVLASGQPMSASERLQRQQDLRLQLLYARMELETGQEHLALARLNQLRQHFPRDPQLMGYTANVENFSGNYPRALKLLSDAQQLTPQNEDFYALRRDIERVYAQEVRLDHTYRRIGNSDEQISTLSGNVHVTHDTEIGIVLQNNELDASGVRRSRNGDVDDFSLSRQRAEIFAAHYLSNGDRLKGSLFANNDTAGAGAYYAFQNPAGRTELLAEYQRPYWDFVEAVSEEANRSRVGALHVANLDERTTVSGELSYNQYNIAIEDDAASSVLIRANIVRRVRDENPTVSVGYGFDGEYIVDEDKRDLPNGDVYRTFPIVSREIHYPSMIVSQDLTSSTHGEVVAGWAFDRLGEDGPQVSGKLTQDVTDDVEAQIRASYGLQTQDTDQNVTHVGGHLRMKF